MSERTIQSVRKSNYLARADVDPAIVVTVKEVVEEELDTPTGPEMKWVVYFEELEKGMVLNWINSQTIAKILGSEAFDDWSGGKIVLYDDPNVTFGKQLKADGVLTALVTNNAAEFRDHWRNAIPLDELFHHVIDSSEVGMRKPDPKIFELALERLGTRAESTVFLDDFQGNLDAAAQLGIRGILVEPDYAPALESVRRLLDREASSA